MTFPSTTTKYITLPSGIRIFYRSAGPPTGPVILILHGFPTSSAQYRNLIPILASSGYLVIVPDLPGFGFTEIPSTLNYKHTFANLASTTSAFIDALSLTKFAIYINDYGAPTGLRIALERPQAITAIVTQNGNAYDEGLGEFWDPLRTLWKAVDEDNTTAISDGRNVLKSAILTFAATKWQYENGEPDTSGIDPLMYNLDWHLMCTPENIEIQLDLFQSYGTNVPLYARFQEYFRNTNVPILAVWGKNDVIFISPGAEAFEKHADSKNVQVELWDGGHFLAETQTEKLGGRIVKFLGEALK